MAEELTPVDDRLKLAQIELANADFELKKADAALKNAELSLKTIELRSKNNEWLSLLKNPIVVGAFLTAYVALTAAILTPPVSYRAK
jgi:hypothetical protein